MKLILLFSSLMLATVCAAVKPASLFQNNMVLQQGMPVPVWGTANPSETVIVNFAGQSQSVVTGADGKWMIKLDSLESSTDPREMKITGVDQVVLKNILVGEVWICSGQYNMQMNVSLVPEIQEIKSFHQSQNVRCFEVKRTVALKEQENLEGKWKEELPTSAIAAGFAHFLEKSEGIPVGIILTCWDNTAIEAWMPRDMVNELPKFKIQMEAFDADQQNLQVIQQIIKKPGKRSTKEDIAIRRQPHVVYNAMIAPLAPYACRGFVWYQGARNTVNFDKMPLSPPHRRLLPVMKYGNALKLWIKRYRKQWNKEDMHFMVVMLPGFARGFLDKKNDPTTKSWAWMREQQLMALGLEHTSVVNTIDLGEANSLSPKDKLPICKRLALLARRNTLGVDVVAEGPVMFNMDVKDSQIMITYDHGDGLKTTDGKTPKGFWISENAKQWEPADAEIKGDQVILSSDKVANPVHVRYAFSAMPEVNLVNAEGLPARPFKTDL